MTPSELEALAKSVEILSKIFGTVGTIGFSAVVTLYLLIGLPKHLKEISTIVTESIREMRAELNGVRSDLQELSGLLKYEARLRGYQMSHEQRERKREAEQRLSLPDDRKVSYDAE